MQLRDGMNAFTLQLQLNKEYYGIDIHLASLFKQLIDSTIYSNDSFKKSGLIQLQNTAYIGSNVALWKLFSFEK